MVRRFVPALLRCSCNILYVECISRQQSIAVTFKYIFCHDNGLFQSLFRIYSSGQIYSNHLPGSFRAGKTCASLCYLHNMLSRQQCFAVTFQSRIQSFVKSQVQQSLAVILPNLLIRQGSLLRIL